MGGKDDGQKLFFITLTFLFVLMAVNTVSAANSTVNLNSQNGVSSTDEHIVVWEDNRDGGTHLYYKNLETSVGGRVSWVNSHQTLPAISGNTVVWVDNRDSGTKIYYKNIDTGIGTRVSW